MSQLTAETVTDEQIRELKAWADTHDSAEADSISLLCRWALERGHVQRFAARSEVAEILNARGSGKAAP